MARLVNTVVDVNAFHSTTPRPFGATQERMRLAVAGIFIATYGCVDDADVKPLGVGSPPQIGAARDGGGTGATGGSSSVELGRGVATVANGILAVVTAAPDGGVGGSVGGGSSGTGGGGAPSGGPGGGAGAGDWVGSGGVGTPAAGTGGRSGTGVAAGSGGRPAVGGVVIGSGGRPAPSIGSTGGTTGIIAGTGGVRSGGTSGGGPATGGGAVLPPTGTGGRTVVIPPATGGRTVVPPGTGGAVVIAATGGRPASSGGVPGTGGRVVSSGGVSGTGGAGSGGAVPVGTGGTPGGGNAAECAQLMNEYDAEMQAARVCKPKQDKACAVPVPRRLAGCGSECTTFVDKDNKLDQVRRRWAMAGCTAAPCQGGTCASATSAVCSEATELCADL